MKQIVAIILCLFLPVLVHAANEQDIEEGNIVYFSADDPDMIQAHKDARSSIVAVT
ncbi:MAG: hypothetical protein HRU38_18370, partial [Saccharospirillaceae bacterium]|nr:hypothetical protein [Saccharospirillaceae bacterium]